MTNATHIDATLIRDWTDMTSLLASGTWSGGAYRMVREGQSRYAEFNGRIDLTGVSVPTVIVPAGALPFRPMPGMTPKFIMPVEDLGPNDLGCAEVTFASNGEMRAAVITGVAGLATLIDRLWMSGTRFEIIPSF